MSHGLGRVRDKKSRFAGCKRKKKVEERLLTNEKREKERGKKKGKSRNVVTGRDSDGGSAPWFGGQRTDRETRWHAGVCLSVCLLLLLLPLPPPPLFTVPCLWLSVTVCVVYVMSCTIACLVSTRTHTHE